MTSFSLGFYRSRTALRYIQFSLGALRCHFGTAGVFSDYIRTAEAASCLRHNFHWRDGTGQSQASFPREFSLFLIL